MNIYEIDKHNLDEEALKQPSLMEEQCRSLADAKKKVEIAEAKLKVAAAELDRDIRKTPAKYGLDKTTEATIANAILLQPKYQRARFRYIEAKHESDILQASVSALEHKKRMIEILVQLYGQSYFADPRITGTTKEQIQKKTRRKGMPKKRES